MAPTPPAPKAPSRPPRRIREAAWWHYALLLPAALLVRLWGATLRWRFDEASASLMRDSPDGTLFVLWHNRLFLTSEIYRRYRRKRGRRVYGLVSASRDGAWLAAFFRLMGLHPIRGSSSWRARTAIREMRHALEQGHDLGITPDGPRGPCYAIQPGAVRLAQHTSRPVVLIGLTFQHAWRLQSWDGFYLPRPFTKVTFRTAPFQPPTEQTLKTFANALRAINPDGSNAATTP